MTATALSSELGISQPTLSRWLRGAQDSLGSMSQDRSTAPASSPAPKARRAADWPAEERLRVVVEAGRLTEAELGAFLRREGLHEATLREWRAAALEGLSPDGTTRSKQKRSSDQKRVRELEREIRRKDRALAETAALLVLQKKVQAIWGNEDGDTESRSDE